MDIPRTKLVCTIGPASVERVRELVDAGMSVARINFSHGTPDEHKAAVHAVRAAAHQARRSVAVMADLPGQKMRLGDVPGGMLELETGQTLVLRPAAGTLGEGPARASAETAEQPSDLGEQPAQPAQQAADQLPEQAADQSPEQAADQSPEQAADQSPDQPEQAADLPADRPPDEPAEQPEPPANQAADQPASGQPIEVAVDHPTLHGVQVGDRVLLADGAAELRVIGLDADGSARTEVVRGGTIRSRSGVNIPTERLSGPALTAADEEAIVRALELRVDMLAQSFVRSADDVRALRSHLLADAPLVVAKIETRAAVDDFAAIAEASDGLMVARGDLGVDIPYEEVPLVQKDLLRRAAAAGRFTIVATQMLESMTVSARPTRAEASDVANAVLDGTDAVMLSAETAIGRFPVEAARATVDICRVTERNSAAPAREPHSRPDDGPSAIVHGAAALAAGYAEVSAAWCFTRTGRTAELLSELRPRVPVLAFTVSAVVARRLACRWGVLPMVMPSGRTGEPLIERMDAVARARQVVAPPTTVLLLTTSAQPGGVNRLELHRLQ